MAIVTSEHHNITAQAVPSGTDIINIAIIEPRAPGHSLFGRQ